ncbi:MAG: preprotein translocase subunit YajC [Burkholderiaceae bacterium]|nr:preprotein translocase subunit YajC [Burkholderiaceae bacterium]
MFVVMYFIMIRPQMKKQKELKAMVDSVAKGTEVITNGGILGKVSKVKDDYLIIEIAPNVEVVIQRNAVANLLQTGTLKSIN